MRSEPSGEHGLPDACLLSLRLLTKDYEEVGAMLSKLQTENRELRTQIEELAAKRRGEEHAA